MEDARVGELVEDLFRRESGRLVAALARVLGPSHLALAEDVVQDALVAAMQAWAAETPRDPRAWILEVARRRAIDRIRRDHRLAWGDVDLELAIDDAASPARDRDNQLAMMFAICDEALAPETHVTLILRLLSGLSPAEIARAFLVDVQTIDRRLHRGRLRLAELGTIDERPAAAGVRARQSSVEHALYLIFNEGYHATGDEAALRPALCADAVRFAELLAEARGAEPRTAHALAALFCLDAARLSTRVSDDGVMVPLAEQDRSRWDRGLVDRGLAHLLASATGDAWTRWHLEAGIALEHTLAPSLAETDWTKIVRYYDALAEIAPGPVVALNRGLALAELRGVLAGREALEALAGDPRLSRYSFYWAARADLERRAGAHASARALYERAAMLAKSAAERRSYEARIAELAQ